MKTNLPAALLMAGLLISTLSGCSLPPKSSLGAEQVYRLSPEVSPVSGHANSNVNLYLPPISVDPALDNRHIMLSGSDNRLDFIANSRWPDKLSSYLQAVIIDGLSESKAFQSVSSRLPGRGHNYRLLLRVSDFQAEFPTELSPDIKHQQHTNIVISLEAILVRTQDQRMMGTYRYQAHRRSVPVKTGRIVAAFEQALGEILAKLTTDLVKATDKR
ncbi:MAG: ABC-type transport auxiliary lipoprotein family protein [Thiolinea sp.]